MIDSDPTSVILTFYREGGEIVNQKVQAPFHYLVTPPFRIKTIRVGSRVALYANVLHNVEGSNVQGYIHLRKGTYSYRNTIQLLTFHADIIS